MRFRASRFFSDRYAYRAQPDYLSELVAFGIIVFIAVWPIILVAHAMAVAPRWPNKSVVMLHQLYTYADLRKQIHEDLRIQHPEWIRPNGESPMCDSYEARLMDLLKGSRPSEPERSSDAIATN